MENKEIKNFLLSTINQFEQAVIEKIKEHEKIEKNIINENEKIITLKSFYKKNLTDDVKEEIKEIEDKIKKLTVENIKLFVKITEYLEKTVAFKSYYNYYKGNNDD